MFRHLLSLVPLVPLASVAIAQEEAPAFDRPGIAFSTTTVPRGSLAVELGVPEFVHLTSGGSTSTTYRFDTNFRTGLTRRVEIQLATPVYNYDHADTGQGSESVTGFGDSSLSLKAVLPSHSQSFSCALLAGATLASGAKAFSVGTTQYRLASSMDEELNETYGVGFYIQFDTSSVSSDYLLSPSFNFVVSPMLSGYFEAAYVHDSHGPDSTLAGGGLAWMATPIVQLDLSLDVGLTHESPKLQGGVGISVYVARL